MRHLLLSLLLFTATLTFAQNDNNNGAGEIDPTQCLPGMCMNGGRCPNDSAEHPLADTQFWRCMCKKGFGGARCEHTVEMCGEEEHHQCFNGGVCVPKKVMSGSHGGKHVFVCDCAPANHHSNIWAGQTCEHTATNFCHQGGMVASKLSRAFCANHGVCKEIVDGDLPHMGCTCEDEWEGDHCEYSKGTKPKDVDMVAVESISEDTSPAKSNTAPEITSAKSPILIFSFIGLAAIIILGFVVMRYSRRRSKTDVAVKEAGDMVLEADGSSTLKNAEEMVDVQVDPAQGGDDKSEHGGEFI